MIRACEFLLHAQANAQTLTEPEWYAMISQLAGVADGAAVIHELSRDYPGYSVEATDKKIAQFIKTGARGMSCDTLRGWGYHCPKLGTCPAKAPWELGKAPMPGWYHKTDRGLRLMPGILANELASAQTDFLRRGGLLPVSRRGVQNGR